MKLRQLISRPLKTKVYKNYGRFWLENFKMFFLEYKVKQNKKKSVLGHKYRIYLDHMKLAEVIILEITVVKTKKNVLKNI